MDHEEKKKTKTRNSELEKSVDFLFIFIITPWSSIIFTFLMNKLNMKEVMKHIQDHVQLVNIRVGILNPFLSFFFNKKKPISF